MYISVYTYIHAVESYSTEVLWVFLGMRMLMSDYMYYAILQELHNTYFISNNLFSGKA